MKNIEINKKYVSFRSHHDLPILLKDSAYHLTKLYLDFFEDPNSHDIILDRDFLIDTIISLGRLNSHISRYYKTENGYALIDRGLLDEIR